MTITLDPTFIGVVFVGLSMLVAIAVTYGKHQRGLQEINRRLDTINGTLKAHGTRLTDQGERIAREEGRKP